MKKWKCTVCGYIHTGDEPPEECPVCGADQSKFVEVTDEEIAQETTASIQTEPEPEKSDDVKVTVMEKEPHYPQYARIYDFVTDQILEHHLHPISVHIPNGVIPLSVFFAFMAVFFHLVNFEIASFYNMIFVVLAMPMVLFSGYTEWQKHYDGARTTLFLTKMICGGIVFLTALIIVIWWLNDPTIASSASKSRWIFLMIHLVMLSAAGVAGYLGGKLVFKD